MRKTVRWGAWFGDVDYELEFPDSWHVETFPPRDRADMTDQEIEDAIRSPIASQPLREIAVGKRTACVVVDDLSRPTPMARLMGPILSELNAAGIPDDRVLILAGVGNHRQMMRGDFIKKVGQDAVERCPVANHFSWDDCVMVGTTSHGTPVEVSRLYADADVKILTGSIVPHPVAGYAGGGKMVLPGVASIRSAIAFHGPNGPRTNLAVVDTPARADIEEAAQLAGVDFIANVIPTSMRGVGGLVAGNVVQAHRVGVRIAMEMNATRTPVDWDVCVLSAYPKDNEFIQHGLVYNLWRTAPSSIVHEGGTVVVADACSEGAGFHSLAGPGMRLPAATDLRKPVAPRDLIFYAPGVKEAEVPHDPDPQLWFVDRWEDVVTRLGAKHGAGTRVAVFPCSAIQVAEGFDH
ncbi:MAG: lactate racemase domain-containing protein [Acidimicrobiia bacterium]